MSMTLNPGTAKQSVLMNVPKYDFDYEKATNLSKWVKVTPSETEKLSCTYDPKLAQELPALRKLPLHYVTWGDGSSDETGGPDDPHCGPRHHGAHLLRCSCLLPLPGLEGTGPHAPSLHHCPCGAPGE